MSRLSKAVSGMNWRETLRSDKTVKNFMGGESYVVNPLDTLMMITASSIFGEPSYYRPSRGIGSNPYSVNSLISEFSVIPEVYNGKKTEDIMEAAIDAALDYDFRETLEWARTLRNHYFMRLNPQVIMVRAALHPKRAEFTKENPGMFNKINMEVMARADEPMSQMAYYLYKNGGSKSNIPSILKRSWSNKLSNIGRYQVAKYKNHEIGMINAVRLCHAHSPVIDELMCVGDVMIPDDDKTWENLRSAGKSWKEIFNTVDMGHMAMLRNIRGVFTEINDAKFCGIYMKRIKDTVIGSKQFPFRYYSALKAVKESSCNHKDIITDALEECMNISIANYPKLKGRTMCLSDNSGSAWGVCNSEYGSATVAEIGNLSSVITAACSDEGYVGKFGDRMITTYIDKNSNILQKARDITSERYNDVGGATEGGIWEFFHRAIRNEEHWDNIFIYSDQQAGHGKLYGTASHMNMYRQLGYDTNGHFINVFKLIQEYRKRVNPKVNVFSVQTAGYDNALIPEYTYRTNLLYGWCGNEAVFANSMILLWDEIEKRK